MSDITLGFHTKFFLIQVEKLSTFIQKLDFRVTYFLVQGRSFEDNLPGICWHYWTPLMWFTNVWFLGETLIYNLSFRRMKLSSWKPGDNALHARTYFPSIHVYVPAVTHFLLHRLWSRWYPKELQSVEKGESLCVLISSNSMRSWVFAASSVSLPLGLCLGGARRNLQTGFVMWWKCT